MNKHIIKKFMAAVAAGTIMATAVPAMPFTGSAATTIFNSTFDSGYAGWSSFKQAGGAYTLGTENGKLALNITSVGTLNYSVQMGYDIVPLYENGVYRLKYDISSTVDREIESMIQQNGGTYTAYTWKKLSLTSTPQTIDYEFTMKYETDIMAKLAFNCGTQGEDLPAHTIYLDNVSLELVDDSNVNYESFKPYEPPVVVNQVGYRTNSKKTAVVRGLDTNDSTVTCHVKNAETNEIVYTNQSAQSTYYTAAKETSYVFDFSDFKTPGRYYVECEGVDDASYEFEISDNPYGSLVDDSVRMLYLQRCGVAVEDQTFSHPACHNTMATVYGTNEKIDVSGGWHDAGDYGRYIVPAAKAVADLLYAYQEKPELYGDNIGIPESGNGVPDVLDEVRFELEWMLKMQSSNGGVYHKVTCEDFPGYVMPQNETEPLIVTPVSSTATADFCAAMAMAYEFYLDIDKNFAEKCLDAAEKAWAYLEANPNLVFDNPDDITTGEYGDYNDRDERFWAAAQMYRATKEAKYLQKAETINIQSGMDWALVGDYGNIALITMDDFDKESTLYQSIVRSIKSRANTFVSTSTNSPYGTAISKFNWGSNMTIANAGVILNYAYQLTGDEKYLTASQAQLDYLLGSNPVGVCFVSGYGEVSPEYPHHRPSMAMKTPMHGMLAGGVNQNLEDNAAKAYLIGTAPAKCYVDNAESYSTNEITIYWNSPLTYLLSLDAKKSGSTTNPDEPVEPTEIVGDVNNDGKFDISDIVAMQKYLTNQGTLTAAVNGDVVKDGKLNVFDLIAMKRMFTGSSNNNSNTNNNNEANENGTEMNANATMVADFSKGTTSAMFASDGWSNGSCFDCVWKAANAVIKDGVLNLTIDKDTSGQYNYSGAEYRSSDHYGYGYYETCMKAIKNDGVVSSFFTYTGPSENNPWDEIDIEILGKDTTKVQLNYYTNGVGNHEVMYDLGFDASEDFHTYGFDWQKDSITWYVDGKAVYTATTNIPSTEGRIMMNVWPGTGVDEWLKPFDGTTPLTAQYKWVTFDEK